MRSRRPAGPAVERTENLIDSTETPLRFLAEVAAADPGYFRTEQSNDLLYRALTSASHIDAVYVSFEDGYHRVVTRIDEDRRRSDPRIPGAANWHASYIDAITFALSRVRHRKFFDVWPHLVGGYDVATDLDIRTLPGYQTAKTTRTLAVTEPSINPDTGFPILSLRVPMFHGVDFIGCASANITMDVLSRFLDKHRASAHSTTLIADRNNGKIIAFPEQAEGRARRERQAQDRDAGRYRRSGRARGRSPARQCRYRQFRVPVPVKRRGSDRGVRQFPGWIRPALAGDHADADRRFRGDAEGDQSVDHGGHHHPHRDRAVLHLFRVQPAVAAGRKRFAAIAGHRKPAIRRAGVAAVQHPGDREAGITRLRCFAPR